MTSPNNHSTQNNPVGRFMVAVGTVINLAGTEKILIIKRQSQEDWQGGEWEIPYGRIDQFEDLEMGLRREIREETGLTDLEIGRIQHHWHIFRGEQTAHNEVIGLTFVAQTNQSQVKLSAEHSQYQWVLPKKALKMIKVPGIKQDIEIYLNGLR